MKKIGSIFKEVSESRIRKSINDSGNFFIVKYSGLSGPDLNQLRLSLRGAGSEMFVVKNTIARRALKELGREELSKTVDGPCGFVFAKEPVGVSKVLYTFAKDHDKLKLESGLLDEAVIGKREIESLAKLPSREILLAQTLMLMKSPITGLVMVLKGNLRKLVFALDLIKQKKSA